MKITKEGIAIVNDDECICRFVKESGRLDHDQNLLPQILKQIKPTDHVVDAGAFIGDHTIAYARAAAFVHAFEPAFENYECMEYNLKTFDNVKLYRYGLGREEKRAGIASVSTNKGMNYITAGDEVRIITLDSLNLEKCDLIKIDVEGYELDVLLGAKKIINKFHPKLIIEINKETLNRRGISSNDIFEFLEENNYNYNNIYSEHTLNDEQLDILAIHRNASAMD